MQFAQVISMSRNIGCFRRIRSLYFVNWPSLLASQFENYHRIRTIQSETDGEWYQFPIFMSHIKDNVIPKIFRDSRKLTPMTNVEYYLLLYLN